MKRLGIGFIGTGKIACIHKRALLKNSRAKLVAVYDTDEVKSSDLVADSEARICKSAEELVTSSEVDVVYVLTPLASHYDNAMLALRAGKHTFVEKPVSLSSKEINEMIRLSKEKACLCVPGHNYIHAPELRSAKEMIESGQLGDVCSLWIFFNVYLPPQVCSRVEGVLREVMIHHFYSTLYLLGKPEWVFAANSDLRGLGPNKEDQALVICKMPRGALVTLFASFLANDLTFDPWTVKYKLIGSHGSASHTWFQSRLRECAYPLWDLPTYLETFREEDRYFIEECVLGGKQPLSDLQDTLTCLDILAASEKSLETGALQRLPT